MVEGISKKNPPCRKYNTISHFSKDYQKKWNSQIKIEMFSLDFSITRFLLLGYLSLLSYDALLTWITTDVGHIIAALELRVRAESKGKQV